MTITQQVLQFIQNHWMICSAFGIVSILLILEELKNKIGGIPRVSAQIATLLLNRENAKIIDLRQPKAFAAGHIIGAINIESADFAARTKEVDAYKNHPLILVAENDTNASPAGVKLQKQGFTKIHILAGGLQAWKDAHLPLTKN